MASPVRIKCTIPPPRVCGSKCWWRTKYARLLKAYKKLRLDYIGQAAKYQAKRRREDEGERVPDVLEMIQ